MAVSLEQYVAEATKAYEPAKTAINTQLGALDSNYNTGEQKINRNYQQQQAGLNNQRNMAAEAASMQAAGSGGSFGGAANLANRKYYDQTFVPAQTQMNTNKSNELDALRQNIENQRTSLNSQLANIDAQANQAALQQYWAAVEAEKQREAQLRAQREAQAAQNAYYKYMMDAMKNQNQGGTKRWDFGGGYSIYAGNDGEAIYTVNGNRISAGQFLQGAGARGANWNNWNDIWNSGVKTNGVGSDTVEAFNGGVRASLNSGRNGKYGYLY
jgi:hypothetical protein